MKVVLTGATGFIGSQVLRDCLSNPDITSIIALSRRELPSNLKGNSSKLRVIVHKDFTAYEPSLIEELKGAEACIWALGVKIGQVSTYEEAKAIEVAGPVSAAKAFIKDLVPSLPNGRKFRFVYVSGALGERNADKKLWFAQDARRLKGEVEDALVEMNTEHQTDGKFEGYAVRPAMVTKAKAEENIAVSMLMGSMMTYTSAIRADELAATMVKLAMKGDPEKAIWENRDMVMLGREIRRERNESKQP